VVSDDGSVYSDVPEENTFGVGRSFTGGDSLGTSYTDDSTVDFITTYGAPARFLQVQNTDSSNDVTCELNGDANLIFTLGSGETQVFNSNDLAITKIKLKGSADPTTALLLASVRTQFNS